MSVDPYNPRVRELFALAAHAGTLESGQTAQIDDQNVRVALSAQVENGILTKLRFRAWGCPHVVAASEAFCAEYEGQSVSELDGFTAGEIMQSLAVPVEKSGRILVLEDAVRSLGAAICETS